MRRVVCAAFVSLDGVMQAPGGPDEDPEGGFPHGGWQAPYADEAMGRRVVEGFADADGFLLGRKTYDIFANYWPKITDPANATTTVQVPVDQCSGPIKVQAGNVTIAEAATPNASVTKITALPAGA